MLIGLHSSLGIKFYISLTLLKEGTPSYHFYLYHFQLKKFLFILLPISSSPSLPHSLSLKKWNVRSFGLCVALSTPTTSKNLCVSLCKNIFISLRQAQDDNRVKQISKNLSYLILKITPISLIRVPKNSTFVTRELCSNWRSNHYSTLKTPATPLKSPQGDNAF